MWQILAGLLLILEDFMIRCPPLHVSDHLSTKIMPTTAKKQFDSFLRNYDLASATEVKPGFWIGFTVLHCARL